MRSFCARIVMAECGLHRLRSVSEEAIAAIYRRCGGPVYPFALHMAGKASLGGSRGAGKVSAHLADFLASR